MKIISLLSVLLTTICMYSPAQTIKTYIITYQGVFNLKYDQDKQYRSYRSVLVEQPHASHFHMLPAPREAGMNEVMIEPDSSSRVLKHACSSSLVFGELDLAGLEKFFRATLHP